MKRGRPSKTDAKNRAYTFRISAEEVRMLADLSRNQGLTKSEILRKGIRMQYNLLQISPDFLYVQ